jgi:hypothetical protein
MLPLSVPFCASRESIDGPTLPRRLSAFVSAIGGLAAAPAVLSAMQLMTHRYRTELSNECLVLGVNRT